MEKLNRTPIIIASVIFAIGLWLTVNLGFDYTTTKDIPIVLENLQQNVALRELPPEKIRARVRGEGWKLLGMKLGGDTKYMVDLENERSTVNVRTTANLSDRLRIPSDIEIAELEPAEFSIELEQMSEKRLPIEPVVEVTFRDGFSKVGAVSAKPDSIVVRGAESLLEKLDSWKTAPLQLRDIREPVRKTVKLSDSLSQIVSIKQQTTELSFDVQPIAEKTISGMEVEVEGVPANREVAIIPPRIDLVIRGGINQLAAIEDGDFTARIHYRDLLADTSGRVTAQIEGPDDVRIVQRSPETQQYVIRRSQ